MSATTGFRALLIGVSVMVVDVSAKTALLVVDVQDCFLEAACTGSGSEGSLSVPACPIIGRINQIRTNMSCLFDEVIFTQDFHPANHISYASTHGLAPFSHLPTAFGGQGKGYLPLKCITPSSGLTTDGACCPAFYLNPSMDCSTTLCPPAGWDYMVNNSDIINNNPACTTCANNASACFTMEQAMWTDHCLQSGDAGFPPTLIKKDNELVVQKGINQYVDAYSGFMDNTRTLKTNLDDKLKSSGIDTLFVVGIATDVCVKESVIDALGVQTAAYNVTVISDATAAVLGIQANFDAAISAMQAAGATISTTSQVLAMDCPTATPTTAPTTAPTPAPTSAPGSSAESSVLQEDSQKTAGHTRKHKSDNPQRFLSASMMELGQSAVLKTHVVEHSASRSDEIIHIATDVDERKEL